MADGWIVYGWVAALVAGRLSPACRQIWGSFVRGHKPNSGWGHKRGHDRRSAL